MQEHPEKNHSSEHDLRGDLEEIEQLCQEIEHIYRHGVFGAFYQAHTKTSSIPAYLQGYYNFQDYLTLYSQYKLLSHVAEDKYFYNHLAASRSTYENLSTLTKGTTEHKEKLEALKEKLRLYKDLTLNIPGMMCHESIFALLGEKSSSLNSQIQRDITHTEKFEQKIVANFEKQAKEVAHHIFLSKEIAHILELLQDLVPQKKQASLTTHVKSTDALMEILEKEHRNIERDQEYFTKETELAHIYHKVHAKSLPEEEFSIYMENYRKYLSRYTMLLLKAKKERSPLTLLNHIAEDLFRLFSEEETHIQNQAFHHALRSYNRSYPKILERHALAERHIQEIIFMKNTLSENKLQNIHLLFQHYDLHTLQTELFHIEEKAYEDYKKIIALLHSTSPLLHKLKYLIKYRNAAQELVHSQKDLLEYIKQIHNVFTQISDYSS